MSADVETIVIGAGVVGLAVARSLALTGHEVMVLEQHELIGSEVSSRNSEVIHAGLYYPPGSLRARLCVEGKRQLYRFCEENGVPHERIEKLLVATAEDQLPKLAAIAETARKNGVDDLVPLDAAAARRLEPAVRCLAALRSPSTGVIDTHALMLALEGHIEASGGLVVLNSPVERIAPAGAHLHAVVTSGGAEGRITCKNLVGCAGLHASRLAATYDFAGPYRVPETYYAKGQYYALTGRSPFTRHIYPVPAGAWLGLHATVDIGGRCKFGPDIEWIPGIDYGFEPAKLERFLDFIRSYYPDLDPGRLHPDYTGIRPKLYREGEPVPDFRIDGPAAHGRDGLVLLYGIESPGLTASLAIGDHVARLIG
jgi:L-2-hydroxyglutarate oxidase LhgO